MSIRDIWSLMKMESLMTMERLGSFVRGLIMEIDYRGIRLRAQYILCLRITQIFLNSKLL